MCALKRTQDGQRSQPHGARAARHGVLGDRRSLSSPNGLPAISHFHSHTPVGWSWRCACLQAMLASILQACRPTNEPTDVPWQELCSPNRSALLDHQFSTAGSPVVLVKSDSRSRRSDRYLLDASLPSRQRRPVAAARVIPVGMLAPCLSMRIQLTSACSLQEDPSKQQQPDFQARVERC